MDFKSRHFTNCCLALACSIPFLSQSQTHAQGLPFHIEKHEPQHSNTVISPRFEERATSKSIQSLSSSIGHQADPTWALSSHDLMFEGEFYKAGPTRPLSDRPSTFIEVTEVISSGAEWLKIKFKQVDLRNAKLSVTSPLTGRSQTFDSSQLAQWGWQSALFLGDRLRVQLQVMTGTEPPPPVDELIEQVLVGESSVPKSKYPDEVMGNEQRGGSDEQAPCGRDKRVPSNERRVGRMVPAWCTVFIIDGHVYASAGHCLRKNRDVQDVQFNVPLSTESGKPNESSIRDTYRVLPETIICSDCVAEQDLKHGKDWAVFLLAKNTQTNQEAIESQGGGFTITSSNTLSSSPVTYVRVDGYGWDNDPPNASYTNQAASGTLIGLAPGSNGEDAEIRHFVDTEGGNSGSPIIALDETQNPTTTVVGIHTGGSCNPSNNTPNMGTGFSHQGLQQAITKLRQIQGQAPAATR